MEENEIVQKHKDKERLLKQLKSYADENLETQSNGEYTCPECGNDTFF